MEKEISGLVIGKFYPLHNGHLALINYAISKSKELNILVCVSNKEKINGEKRKNWILGEIKNGINVNIIVFNYNENDLPNTSVSSRSVSKIWARKIFQLVPAITCIFSSEQYGNYLGEELNVKHIDFDYERSLIPISSSQIRKNPFLHWSYIPKVVQAYYTKKIILLGTESTGKSMLTERLANYYKTGFVPEMAREIIEKTIECTQQHLIKISELHAKKILEKLEESNKLLFIDTDINITKSYSEFLFNKTLIVEDWIEQANKGDIYFYLDADAPYIQDGTRLSFDERNRLDYYHKNQLENNNIKFIQIQGNWNERFNKMILYIDTLVNNA